MKTIETIQTILAIAAGGTLAAMQVRWHFKKGLPILNSLFSKAILQDIDSTDKKMISVAGFFFVCLVATVIYQHW